MKNRCVLFFAGLLMFLTLVGCGSKYHLHFDGYGLTSPKTAYADGEPVTVYYDMIATDTDYSFYLDEPDVELEQDFDGEHGYVLKFNMPAHDVTVTVESRNSMEYVPEPDIQPERESISEEVVWEKPSEPEDKDAEWKKAYLEIFEDAKMPIEDKEWLPRASFFYLDDDDIPEMFIVYNYEDQPETQFAYPPIEEGGMLYSFADGSAVEVCTSTVSCIPEKGLYFAGFYEGSDRSGTEKIGKWDGKTTEWIWEGSQEGLEYYSINGNEVTVEEYYADIKRYYDDSQADYGGGMKYDAVIEFLSGGKADAEADDEKADSDDSNVDEGIWKKALKEAVEEKMEEFWNQVSDSTSYDKERFYKTAGFAAIYIDDNAIPEIAVIPEGFAVTGTGAAILYWYDNEIHCYDIDRYGSVEYIPYEGKISQTFGMRSPGYEEVKSFPEMKDLGTGGIGSPGCFDGTDHTFNGESLEYRWNDVPVSEAEYKKEKEKVFCGDVHELLNEKTCTYDEIMELLTP